MGGPGAGGAPVVGRRRVCQAGLTVFTVASLLAGAAPNAATLVAARALQDIGADRGARRTGPAGSILTEAASCAAIMLTRDAGHQPVAPTPAAPIADP